KGVKNAGAHVGRAIMSDQVVGINVAELWVSIDPAADYERTVAAVQAMVDSYPGFHRTVRTHAEKRRSKILPRARDPVVGRVYADVLATLREQGEEVRRAISGVDGIADARVDRPVDEPTVEIKVDLASARRHHIKPGDVRRAAATLVTGIEVGSLFE